MEWEEGDPRRGGEGIRRRDWRGEAEREMEARGKDVGMEEEGWVGVDVGREDGEGEDTDAMLDWLDAELEMQEREFWR